MGGRDPKRQKVLIAGGGPVGMVLALALAKQGISCLIVEADTTVCVGSRAICLSRRTLEILDKLGVLEPFTSKGLSWTTGRTFYRTDMVLQFAMSHDADQRLAPMTNLQQYYIEQFLLDAIEDRRDLIEIRWGRQVISVLQSAESVAVELLAGGRSYLVEADYLAACDGARSQVRQSLGLKMSGTAYEGRYVIVDIEADIELPTERLAWFDPPSNPRRTMLMHKQPDNLWRLDYQLFPDEVAEEMIAAERVAPVVTAHLAMMKLDVPWRLVWSSTYRALAVSLDRCREGRILFCGDAAHLVPIFGVRGLNSGIDDVFNLAWKVAYVLNGVAPERLLDSYSDERRLAWEANIANAMKSTEFMDPPSHAHELMRDAALSLASSNSALGRLANPRQSSAISYSGSALNGPSVGEFRAGPRPGMPLPECPLEVDGGGATHLTRLLPNSFALLVSGEPSERVRCEIEAWRSKTVDIAVFPIDPTIKAEREGPTLIDARGRHRALYDAQSGTAYLVRPDGHVSRGGARQNQLRSARLSRPRSAFQPEKMPAMAETWTDEHREQSYSALCEALAEAGRDQESILLARLALLLAEALADAAAFDRCLRAVQKAGSSSGRVSNREIA